MSNSLNILSIIKNITSGHGITDVFFAGNKIQPPLLAFAVHFTRLTIVIKGTYETQIEKNNEITNIRLQPNQAMFIPANCWDKPDMSHKSQTLHLLFGKSHIGISLITTGHKIVVEKIGLKSTLTSPIQKIIDVTNEIHDTKKKYPSFNHLISALLSYLIHSLEDYQKPPVSNSNLLFQDICVYIQENFQREISRSIIAKQYDITPNHLSRLFKQNGYMKFCNYVNYVRINRAKFLLKQYNFTLYQVAKRCGYNDTVYFCRIFKKIVKKTATQYRNG